MQRSPIENRDNVETPVGLPPWLQIASVFLLLVVVIGAVGIVLAVRHLIVSAHVETLREVVFDVAWLIERALQWAIACTALWALRVRREVGRWLTAGVAAYLAVKVAWGSRGALYVMLGRPDTASRVAYETPVEGFAGLVVGAVVTCCLLAVAYSMMFNDDVQKYFRVAQSR